MHDLSVVIPAYLAEDSIVECLENLFDLAENNSIDAEYIVVVDGSPDDTFNKLKTIKNRSLRIESNLTNLGKGASLRKGARLAEGNFISFFDGDLDIDPKSLADMFYILKLNSDLDGVIGSKVHPSSVLHYPILRKILSFIYRKIVKSTLKLQISDTQTGVKVFRSKSLLKALDLSVINGFSFDLELLTIMNRMGFKISEAPVILNYSFGSTVSIRSAIQAISDIFTVWKIHKFKHKD